MTTRRYGAALLAALCGTSATAAEQAGAAQDGLTFELLYKADAVAGVSGGVDTGVGLLGNGEIVADADLERLIGWQGASARVHLLSVHGDAPNDFAGTIQGIDNIEASRDRTKLYQIWIEQNLAKDRASLRVGMTDLNAEFYQNDASGLLIAPAFGVGSELAASGPNGPSIFPSTALAARLRITSAGGHYAQAALFNAKAGVLGDAEGIDFAMRDGALAIGEAGWARGGKIALGYWRYTNKQPDIRDLDAAGLPVLRTAHGVYAIAERTLWGSEDSGRKLDIFARAGASDGDTTAFGGGWQAGLLLSGALPGRPDSQLSIGVNQAYLSGKYRQSARAAGQMLGRVETGFEITYQDRVAPFLAVQPDLQYIRNPSADPRVDDAVVVGLRFIFSKSFD